MTYNKIALVLLTSATAYGMTTRNPSGASRTLSDIPGGYSAPADPDMRKHTASCSEIHSPRENTLTTNFNLTASSASTNTSTDQNSSNIPIDLLLSISELPSPNRQVANPMPSAGSSLFMTHNPEARIAPPEQTAPSAPAISTMFASQTNHNDVAETVVNHSDREKRISNYLTINSPLTRVKAGIKKATSKGVGLIKHTVALCKRNPRKVMCAVTATTICTLSLVLALNIYNSCENADSTFNTLLASLQAEADILQQQLGTAEAELAEANQQLNTTNVYLALANSQLFLANQQIANLTELINKYCHVKPPW